MIVDADFVQKHGGLVRTMVSRSGVHQNDWEDAEQQCWLNIVSAMPRYNPTLSKVSSYVGLGAFRAARWYTFKVWKYRSQFKPAEELAHNPSPEAPEEFSQEDRLKLIKAVDRLPAMLRRVVCLVHGFWDGEPRSTREIASILETNRTYVSKWYREALEILRDDPEVTT